MSTKPTKSAPKANNEKWHHFNDLAKEQIIELEKLNSAYKGDNLIKVPKDFSELAVTVEKLFLKMDPVTGVATRKGEYTVRAVNKKYDLHVWVPPGVRFIIRQLDGKYDMGICSKCGLHESSGPLSCTPATISTINKCISTAPPGTKKIYIPIRLYRGDENFACKRNEQINFHANGLVIDMHKKTMSVYDPNGMQYEQSKEYTEFFSFIAKKLITDSIPYEYKVADESCGFEHARLCRYAVFLKALELHLNVKDFMSFVLDCLKHRYMLLTLPKRD